MRLGSKIIVAVVVLAAILIMTSAGVALAAPPWPDAPNSWWMSSYGVTDVQVGTVADGYADGLFRPANSVTRGQATKMVVNGLGVDPLDPPAPTFLDVPKGHTFFTFIEGAYDAGLVNGYPVTGGLEFRPDNNMTRQQANTVLGRYLSDTEILVTGLIHGTGGLTYATLEQWYAAQGGFYLNGFLDAAQVALVHRPTTAYLVYHGVVQGSNGRLNPNAILNRAQTAAMVLRTADEAAEITTPPPAPTDLVVTPASPGRDTTPQVSGMALPNRPVAVYDTFGGSTTKLTETTTNAAGMFYADLTVPLADGTHVLTAKVKNALGVVSPESQPVQYVLDTVAPTGTVTAPVVPLGQVDAAMNTDKPAFTVNAADERSGVDSVTFQYATAAAPATWVPISTDDDGAPYVADWGTISLAEGQYLFRAIITDVAGNTTTLQSVPVTVDTTAPTAEIAPGSLVPQGADGIYYTEDNKPPFGATAADTTGGAAGTLPSGVMKVEFFYALIPPAPVAWSDFTLISTDLGTSGFADYPVAGLADGEYIFAVRSTDRAGNESLLMTGNPATYVPGVVQQVVIDNAAPVVAITAPLAGTLVPDSSDYTITWTLTDVSAPATVKIEYSPTGADPWTVIDAAAPFTPGLAGSYVWSVPGITGADVTTYKVRITAVDNAGAPVGDIAGHTTVATSAAFTVYDSPEAATSVVGSDPDTTLAGVDWNDFHAVWTVSASAHVVLQQVFLLPDGQALNLTTAPVDVPVAQYSNNTTAQWDSTDALTTDSRGAALVEDDYKIYIVVEDPAGRTATAESAPFAVTAP